MTTRIASGTQTGILSLIMAILCCATALADTRPKEIRDYTEGFPRRANVHVPRRPLQVTDVERWALMLGASDAQREYMLHEYQVFVERHNAYLDQEGRSYVAMSAELSEMRRSRGLASRDVVELSSRLDAHSKRIGKALRAIEQEYISTLEPILTPEQHQRIAVLRHEATRRSCRTFYSHGRWTDVELRRVWSGSAAEDASPDERERVEMLLADYEAQLTPLVCRKAAMVFERRRQQSDDRIARVEGTITPVEARERRARMAARSLDLLRRIRSLHERTIDRIADALSEDLATAFIAAADREAFPELYPDRSALHALFADVVDVDHEPLDADAERIVTALRMEYEARYEQVCQELEEMCIESAERVFSGRDMRGHQRQHLPDALKPLLEQRAALSREYLEKLRERLGDEALERHAALIPEALREREHEAAVP